MKVHRRPAVAGAFYEKNPEQLRQQIENCYHHKLGPGSIPKVNRSSRKHLVGLVVPHAGYMYSGPVACHSYAALAQDGIPDTAIILGPNHTGMGSGVSIQTEGAWTTPLGEAVIDTTIAKTIMKRCGLLEEDEAAQVNEHSVEVQVPMLQFLYGEKVKIVPIVIMLQYLDVCREISKAIAETVKGKNAVIIASSDFTHYEPAAVAQEKDKRVLSNIENLDGEELLNTVEKYNITMCGPAPVATMLLAAPILGADSSKILKYSTSGDITGESQAVVGYGSAKVSRASVST